MSKVFSAPHRAGAGVLLLALSVTSIAVDGVTAAAFVAAALAFALLSPDLVGSDDSERAVRRFGYSALTCFGIAVGLYGWSMSLRGTGSRTSQQVALVGFAFWAVALLLATGTAWHWTRLGRLTRDE